MSERKWKGVTIAGAIMSAAALIAALVAGIFSAAPPGGAIRPAPKPTTSPTTGVGSPNAATMAKFTVDPNKPAVDCPTLVKGAGHQVVNSVYLYAVGVRKAVQSGNPALRQWSDAVSVLLPGGTPAEKRQNLITAICLDPFLGSLWAHAESTWYVGTWSVLEHNAWLRPFADVSQVNDQAASFEATFVNSKGLSEAEATAYVNANKRWQKVAEAVGTLISILDPQGIKALHALKNWDVQGLVANGLPEAKLNASQPDDLAALVLAYTEKGACAPLLVVGANVGDRRPEVFATPTCAKSAAPAATRTTPPGAAPPLAGQQPAPAPVPQVTVSPAPTVPQTQCTPSGVTENCGKDARLAPSQPPVVSCPGGYMDRYTQTCVYHTYTPPPAPAPQPPPPGKGDSGYGAGNTVSPPATSSPAASPAQTSAPPSPMATPSF